MLDKKRIKELLEASVDGTITAKQVTAAGLHRSILQELVESGTISPKYAVFSERPAYFQLFCSKNVTVHVDSLGYGVTDMRLSGLFGFRTVL